MIIDFETFTHLISIIFANMFLKMFKYSKSYLKVFGMFLDIYKVALTADFIRYFQPIFFDNILSNFALTHKH